MKVCGRLFRPKEWLYILLLMCLPLEVTRSLTLNPIKFANIQTIYPMSRYPNYCLSRHHPIQPRNHCHHSPPLLPCLPNGIQDTVKDASKEHAIIIAFVDLKGSPRIIKAFPSFTTNLTFIYSPPLQNCFRFEALQRLTGIDGMRKQAWLLYLQSPEEFNGNMGKSWPGTHRRSDRRFRTLRRRNWFAK